MNKREATKLFGELAEADTDNENVELLKLYLSNYVQHY